MALGHERLDVYRLAIAYVAWVYEKSATLEGVHRAARDQWLRCSVGWAEEDTRCGNRKKPTLRERRKSIPIPIPIAIAIWMRPSPNKAVDAPRCGRLTAGVLGRRRKTSDLACAEA